MKKIVLLLMLALLLISGPFLVIMPTNASPATTLKVEPQEVTFWSGTTPPGSTFKISIIAQDVANFYGWQFVLRWTPGVIDCIGETINYGIWPQYMGPWITEPINNEEGWYQQSLNGKDPSPPVTGTFWLVNLTFRIVQPAPYMGLITTELKLEPGPGMRYCLVDYEGNEIPHEFEHGRYNYLWSPPTINPHLEVEYTGEPEVHSKTFFGKNIYKAPFTFSVDVVIKNVDAGWMLAGTQFILRYNTTILDVLSIEQGTFFEGFTTQTFFYSQWDEGAGLIRVAYCILDVPNMVPPYGEGLIARITFNATYQEKFPATVSSILDIQIDTEGGMGSYFVNYLAGELPYDEAIDGYYALAGYVVGRVIDVFTQYPEPYGGQGIGAPSDMFWPQQEVVLYAKVTYNEWPVQNKPVSFQVLNPKGRTMTILTGITNAFGIATVSFRMSWPCVEPEDLFGVWTVVATVDIAGIVVNDTLQFHYDYLVHLRKVTTYNIKGEEDREFDHYEWIVVEVEYTSYAMQNYWVAITATLHDELNYPLITGTVGEWKLIGGATWCQAKTYKSTFTLHVDKSVCAGTGTIHVSALTNLPMNGGCALCPEATVTVDITAK